MEKILEIIGLGFAEGLVWFPLVLGIGFVFRYLNQIDVSIDGIVIMVSIIFTMVFNVSGNFFISAFISLLSSSLLYTLTFIFIEYLRISSLLSGIIFSLILHSISTLTIGESLPLKYELLPFNFDVGELIFITLLIIIVVYLFTKSKFGTKTIVSASNTYFNSSIGYKKSRFVIYLISGCLIGIGTVIYTSRLGMSRAGGGFDFLITTLTSYLLVNNLTWLLKKVKSMKNFIRASVQQKSTTIIALIGSIIFQISVLTIIYYTPNPNYWKLFFGIVLVLLVAKYNFNFSRGRLNGSIKSENLVIKDLYLSFGHNKTQQVFKKLNIEFLPGVNIIWGSNGTGKSSILNLINGNIIPDEGFITFRYKPISYFKNEIFYSRQNAYETIATQFSIKQNKVAASKYYGLESLKLDINLFDHNESQLAENLSGGQVQNLARELVTLFKPHIFLADEPTSGMDEKNFVHYISFIKRMAINKKHIILVTHDNRFRALKGNHINLDKIKQI